jgi:hypothetical protein
MPIVVPIAPPRGLPRENGPISGATAALLLSEVIHGQRIRVVLQAPRCANFDCQHQKGAHADEGTGPCMAKPCRREGGCKKFEVRVASAGKAEDA